MSERHIHKSEGVVRDVNVQAPMSRAAPAELRQALARDSFEKSRVEAHSSDPTLFKIPPLVLLVFRFLTRW
jgi:hypothetical protein